MCQVTELNINGRKIRMADIKQKYIGNILDAAQKCDYIDKIILFGSSLEERCKEDSDIDLAVFGNLSKGRCLTSKKYKNFVDQIVLFDDLAQAYDILYFKTGASNRSGIMNEIFKGETIYERKAAGTA